MKDLIKNFANLIKVKSLVTFVIVGVFAILSINGNIASENVMTITTTVIAFYYGTQHEKKGGGNGGS
jgi:hypothetical protein